MEVVIMPKRKKKQGEMVLQPKDKKWIKGESYMLHKEGVEGWVVVKVVVDEENNSFTLEKMGCPDYKTICIEKAKRLIYSLWF